ncbi:MAG: hypothetical protein KDJ99_08545, partial [Candidatus Competibacteraceae bacterium]|nr:hypothetical protein [Candidatus Competibacteraceae bacterium]
TDGLDQGQVKSRLRALAETLDSRGWAVKNVTDASVFTPPTYIAQEQMMTAGSDRLVQAATLPSVTSPTAIYDAVDVMDDEYSPAAQKIEQMIEQSEQQRRQDLVESMQNPQPVAPAAPLPDTSQMFQPVIPSTAPPAVSQAPVPSIPAEPTLDEAAFLENVHKAKAASRSANSHIKRIPTAAEAAQIEAEEAAAAKAKAAEEAQAKAKEEAVKRLAVNDDLNIATIAREANKDSVQTLGDDEVVISLH